MKPVRVFIGLDERETLAYAVLSHSIIRRSSVPVSITPVARHHLQQDFTRPRGEKESTAFSISRFLVPWLSDYEGYSIFLDCDMVCLANISELLEFALSGLKTPFARERFSPDEAVWVCQHDYTPKEETKFLGHKQTKYPRKNWSSLMLFNNSRCRALTPKYVNEASGLELHRFQWLKTEQIGSLPLEWNWLIGEYPKNPEAKLLHYTLGTPNMPGYENCDHADLWRAERDHMIGSLIGEVSGESEARLAVSGGLERN